MTELQRQMILHQLIDLQKRVETAKHLLTYRNLDEVARGQAQVQLAEREYAVARMLDVCMACDVKAPE